jgi:hypothetical protein
VAYKKETEKQKVHFTFKCKKTPRIATLVVNLPIILGLLDPPLACVWLSTVEAFPCSV